MSDRCPHCGRAPYRNAAMWPAEDVSRLRDCWQRGLTSGQIVRKFGGKYSRSAIMGKIGRLGMRRRPQ